MKLRFYQSEPHTAAERLQKIKEIRQYTRGLLAKTKKVNRTDNIPEALQGVLDELKVIEDEEHGIFRKPKPRTRAEIDEVLRRCEDFEKSNRKRRT